ncbi:hypothetical protein ETR_19958 [Erwinia tracheiphila PSU-1]|nr:hypothetical protein ETR_19958 [Erwinia tracheiphila PSU-1]
MASSKGQISDELRDKMAPLIPEHKTRHPPGMHRKRVDNRAAMNAIFFVLRPASLHSWKRRGAEPDEHIPVALSAFH